MRLVKDGPTMTRYLANRSLLIGKKRKLKPNSMRADTSELVVEGIRVEIVRKNIKNVHLRVYPPDGRVRVSVPKTLSSSVLDQIVEKRLDWIRSQQAKVAKLSPDLRFETGEKLQFSGKSFTLSVVPTNGRNGVKLCEPGIIELAVRSGTDSVGRRKVIENWYRAHLMERVQPLMKKWEEILGVSASEWHIKKMTTRWGSCNVLARRIWLSLELAKKSDDYLEYVVIHELVHLIERGHGTKFVALMDSVLPNWRILRKELNAPS